MLPVVLEVADAMQEVCAATHAVMGEFPTQDDMTRLHAAIDATLASR